VHFCPQCTKILSVGRHGDYFAFLGVPRKLNLEEDDLEQRFRMLSRQFHPDYFYNAPPAERRASLERSSYLNDAYRTLRDPLQRVDYLLQLVLPRPADRPDGTKARDAIPPALLEEFFALNEELDDIRELRAVVRLPKRGKPGSSEPVRQSRPRAERMTPSCGSCRPAGITWSTLTLRTLKAGRSWRRCASGSWSGTNISNLLEGIERELTQ